MNLWSVALIGFGSLLFVAKASATVFYIDRFQITKNGNEAWFDDHFSDGVVPPSSESVFPNGTPGRYIVRPNPLPGSEQESRVTLNTAAGFLVKSSVTEDLTRIQRARVPTNRSNDPADQNGLKKDHTFAIKGVFELIEPTLNGEFYGIDLTDFGADDPNDITLLVVQRTSDGEWRVQFMEADVSRDVFIELDSYPLTSAGQLDQYEQIELTLTKANKDATSITASFKLIDVDESVPDRQVSLAGSANLFDGERWTRPGFLVVKLSQRGALIPLINAILFED